MPMPGYAYVQGILDKAALVLEAIKPLWAGLRAVIRPGRTEPDDAETIRLTGITRTPQELLWSTQNILFLGLLDNAALVDLASQLSDQGASVDFQPLTHLQQIYRVPLEQYSIVIIVDEGSNPIFDVSSLGKILRHADLDLIIVWASDSYPLSHVTNKSSETFCDVMLALPATAEDLSRLLGAPR